MEKEEEELKPRKCERCGQINSPELDYCSRCRAPLTVEARLKVEEEERKRQKELLSIITPEIVRKMIDERFKQLKEEFFRSQNRGN